MGFPAHGDVGIEWLGSVLVVRPRGPFNAEGAAAINAVIESAIESAIERRCSTGWIRVEHFSGNMDVGTPDAHAQLQAHLEHSQRNGCRRIILVNANDFVKSLFKRACQELGLPLCQSTGNIELALASTCAMTRELVCTDQIQTGRSSNSVDAVCTA